MRADGKPDIRRSVSFESTTWVGLEHHHPDGSITCEDVTLEQLLGDFTSYPLEGQGTDGEPVSLPANYTGWRAANMSGPAALAAWKRKAVDTHRILSKLFNSPSSYRRGRRLA